MRINGFNFNPTFLLIQKLFFSGYLVLNRHPIFQFFFFYFLKSILNSVAYWRKYFSYKVRTLPKVTISLFSQLIDVIHTVSKMDRPFQIPVSTKVLLK